jgi:hypothetical protein
VAHVGLCGVGWRGRDHAGIHAAEPLDTRRPVVVACEDEIDITPTPG